jgi:hypothetical protein
VAYTLGIDLGLVSVKPSNNLTAPNNAESVASITSELCTYVCIVINNVHSLFPFVLLLYVIMLHEFYTYISLCSSINIKLKMLLGIYIYDFTKTTL